MDIKLKNYSHSITTKVIVFIMVVLCFTGGIAAILNVAILNDGDFGIVLEDNYFLSKAFMRENDGILRELTNLISEYKGEEHILKGGTINQDEMRQRAEVLFSNFRQESGSYNPNLSEEENYKKFREVYADEITQVRGGIIRNDLREYNLLLQKLEDKGLVYYVSDGVNALTNRVNMEKGQFKSYPFYMIFENYKREIYPKEIENNAHLYWATARLEALDPASNVLYMAFTKEALNQKIKEWNKNKAIVTNNLYGLTGALAGFLISFIYLALVIGRNSFKDQELHLNAMNRLFNDINLGLCIATIGLWVASVRAVGFENMRIMIIPITIPFATAGFVLVLSLVKHFKNKTIIKHTLTYFVFYKVWKFIRDVYDSGSVGIKVVVIIIGYPIITVLTFFMFPITMGIAAWLAFKRVKAFNAIKEGVERIKAGDIHHIIDVGIGGEFGRLAANINSITDGLKKAVDSELKSERLKTELITNVSHDIRTPLTSIITYVDLLKKEKNPSKVAEYIEVLDQKSQRLKILTDDLFEAAKATSGNISVNFERIDIVSLMTQGLGELNDKVEASGLEFRMNHPKENVYITADGKLLWRCIENLLSNIFKYALKGSRVYIDIEDLGSEILLTIKNISACELNISAEELMERFKRGDESRSSQGSGLGLSIAKSLIEAQKGRFFIQVDGDLFKAVVCMPGYRKVVGD